MQLHTPFRNKSGQYQKPSASSLYELNIEIDRQRPNSSRERSEGAVTGTGTSDLSTWIRKAILAFLDDTAIYLKCGIGPIVESTWLKLYQCWAWAMERFLRVVRALGREMRQIC